MLTVLQAQITDTGCLDFFSGQKSKARDSIRYKMVIKKTHQCCHAPIIHTDIYEWFIKSNRAFYDSTAIVPRTFVLIMLSTTCPTHTEMYYHIQSHLAIIALGSDNSHSKSTLFTSIDPLREDQSWNLFIYSCILTTITGNFLC